jgi:hypothetical protein
MTDKLQTVKEALERQCMNMAFIINNVPIANDFFYEKFKTELEVDRKALTELKSYVEARESEEMVERVAVAILMNLDLNKVHEKESYLKPAKAAIKAMEGNENDKKF